MTADIITIGDELLIGQVVDTNSAYMAAQLNKAGFSVNRSISIHDSREEILAALSESLNRSEIVLLTGGLGPTKDDITKHTLCEFFGTKLVFNQAALDNVWELLKGRVKNLNSLNRDQAMVPENCTVLQNKAGTAPIMWFENKGKVVISMPGVPSEMMFALDNDIIPKLQTLFKTPFIEHRTYIVQGYGEAILAEFLTDWENNLPESIKLAYLPDPGIVRLRMSSTSFDKTAMSKLIDDAEVALLQLLGDSIIASGNQKLEELVANLLIDREETFATAESCTGGTIAKMITAIPGASNFFVGGVVAYSNDLKIKLLNVDDAEIKAFGAVSEPIVKAMVKGALELTGADWAIATSGIAGPSGGTSEKPVGTVWIAVGNKDFIKAEKFQFGKFRDRNIQRSAISAITMLMKHISS